MKIFYNQNTNQVANPKNLLEQDLRDLQRMCNLPNSIHKTKEISDDTVFDKSKSYKLINEEIVLISDLEIEQDLFLGGLKLIRNSLLIESDEVMSLSDYLTAEELEALKVWRQALRDCTNDLPETITASSFNFIPAPSEILELKLIKLNKLMINSFLFNKKQ